MSVRAVVWLLVGLAAAVSGGLGIYVLTNSSTHLGWGIAGLGVSGLAAVVATGKAFQPMRVVHFETYDQEQLAKRLAKHLDRPGPTKDLVRSNTARRDAIQVNILGYRDVSIEQVFVKQIEELEREADELLRQRIGERRRTIFDIRADLNRLGIWSTEDVENFDRAVRVRNAIVHADPTADNEMSVYKASHIISNLTKRIADASE